MEGPIIETYVSASGTVRGISAQEIITFIGTPTAGKGVIHGVGKGILRTTGDRGEPEMVSYTGEGIGRLDLSGSMKWRGSVFTRKQYYSKTSDPTSPNISQKEENCHFSTMQSGFLKVRLM